MNVLLVNPPTQERELLRASAPLGLAYVASHAREAGFNVSIYDAYLDTPIDVQSVVARIMRHNWDVIGFNMCAYSVENTIRIASALKAHGPRIVIVVGGHQATATHQMLLEATDAIDIVVRGEGEHVFTEVLDSLRSKRSLASVKGISFRNGRDTTLNPAAKLMTASELDELPFPAWDLLPSPVEYARKIGHPRICARIVASRGCTNRCEFCSIAGFYGSSSKNSWRARKVENVLREVDELVSNFGIERITFNDDSFLVDLERVRALAEGMMRRPRPVEFVFSATSRDVLRARALLPVMRKSGCCAIEIGIESASDFILQALGKPSTVQENEEAIRAVQAAGIGVLPDLIMFHPLSTIDSLRSNVEFLKKNKLWGRAKCDVLWNRLEIFPGTALFSHMDARGETNLTCRGVASWKYEDAEMGEIANLVQYAVSKLVLPLHRVAMKAQWLLNEAARIPQTCSDRDIDGIGRISARARLELISACRVPYDIFEKALAQQQERALIRRLADDAVSEMEERLGRIEELCWSFHEATRGRRGDSLGCLNE